jgi:hypothetical protein
MDHVLDVQYGVRYAAMRATHAAAAAACLGEQFSHSGLLASALGLRASELQPIIEQLGRQIEPEALSIVAFDDQSNELLGCFLMRDDAVAVSQQGVPPPRMAPLHAFLAQLRQCAPELAAAAPGSNAHWVMAATSRRNRGICTKMLALAQSLARARGYQRIVAECTAAASQHVAVQTFGHAIRAELRYGDFVYENQRPFERIMDPPSCLLTIGAL